MKQNTRDWVSPSGEIIQGPDGVYRWAYDFNMLTNPTILFTVFKGVSIGFGFMWVFEIALLCLVMTLSFRSFWGPRRYF